MWQLTSRPGARIEVLEAGLACCALEVEAAQAAGWLEPVEESSALSSDGQPAILVVAGTVTKALEPAVARWYADRAEAGPVRVMSFGACSISGGPYWDAPTVVTGIDATVPVSSYVPGCPPRPEALVAELERIVDELVGDGVVS